MDDVDADGEDLAVHGRADLGEPAGLSPGGGRVRRAGLPGSPPGGLFPGKAPGPRAERPRAPAPAAPSLPGGLRQTPAPRLGGVARRATNPRRPNSRFSGAEPCSSTARRRPRRPCVAVHQPRRRRGDVSPACATLGAAKKLLVTARARPGPEPRNEGARPARTASATRPPLYLRSNGRGVWPIGR